jgi:hypothetical protein
MWIQRRDGWYMVLPFLTRHLLLTILWLLVAVGAVLVVNSQVQEEEALGVLEPARGFQ